MATPFKRGKVYYHYYTDAKGKQRKRSTGLASKKQAQEEADAFIARIKVANLRGYDAELKLVEAIIAYEADGKSPRFLDKIAKEWGHRKVSDMKPAWVRSHARDLYPDALPSTLNRQVITPVQSVINHAYQAQDGRQIKIEKFEVKNVKKKSAVDGEWHEKFAKHAISRHMAVMARFMYETAARISEAVRVLPEDVDLVSRTVALTKTKTKPRVTRISEPLANMIAELMTIPPVRHRKNKRKLNGLFGYASRHAVYNGWKTTCDRAGIAYAPPHSSGRVSFATELVVKRGVDVVTAAKLGGWASPKVMMDTYAKADEGHAVIDSVFGDDSLKPSQNKHKIEAEGAEPENTNENNELATKIKNARP
ncbi:tyrosine-type recombinase/integrase [Agrobacterium burrii]|uniref:Tyrosine-type recombinase/integrase n=1 Tax=Agrobacterium burrii TaxID=2815339 RepID=A0ABS3ERU9_9HYPH|nr:tyrosine-type recombinase/integrase [Agrobacterium burrii]MBO0134613.1 tyrosine-type recombinase/integrase [Agrobacterium burrii]